jgi:orotate phosphoribosyltransferase
MIKDLNEYLSKSIVVVMLVGVDRQQPIQHGGEEMQRFCDQLGVKALPVVQVLEVIEAMVKRGSLNSGEATKIKNYVATGVL